MLKIQFDTNWYIDILIILAKVLWVDPTGIFNLLIWFLVHPVQDILKDPGLWTCITDMILKDTLMIYDVYKFWLNGLIQNIALSLN